MVHYGKEGPAKISLGEPTIKENVSSSKICSEWKIYRQFMIKKPKENMKLQLKELASNVMMTTMFPNLHTIASISLSIPVTTASVERSFTQMKLRQTCLQSSLKDTGLSHLMEVAVESPTKLTDAYVEEIVDVWNRKNRRVTA